MGTGTDHRRAGASGPAGPAGARLLAPPVLALRRGSGSWPAGGADPERPPVGRSSAYPPRRGGRGLVARPVFKTGRASQPGAWKVRFLRRFVAACWSRYCARSSKAPIRNAFSPDRVGYRCSTKRRSCQRRTRRPADSIPRIGPVRFDPAVSPRHPPACRLQPPHPVGGTACVGRADVPVPVRGPPGSLHLRIQHGVRLLARARDGDPCDVAR